MDDHSRGLFAIDCCALIMHPPYASGAAGAVHQLRWCAELLQVGKARWWLLPDTAVLKVAPTSYMFCLPDNVTFYCVTFAENTPVEVRSSQPDVVPTPDSLMLCI
jgi:hypothetical protein